MKTNASRNASLQHIIVDTMGRQTMTMDELFHTLNGLITVREQNLSLLQLARIVQSMVKNGKLGRSVLDSWSRVKRYYVPQKDYVAEMHDDPRPGTPNWRLTKYDEGRFNGIILGSRFSEADARFCAAALNERDQKIRSLQQRATAILSPRPKYCPVCKESACETKSMKCGK